MESIDKYISFAEKELKQILEEFFIRTWGDTLLWSHDLDHHRRVWKYAKEILDQSKEVEYDALFIRNLLIASYLHDIGMSQDQGVKHGVHSKMLAEEFLVSNNLESIDFQNALYAIENHDNKEYNKEISDNLLLRILSIADDLDAFGETGITRYLEIYLARGVPDNRIADAILENASARFANFEFFAAGKPELYEKHKERYLILKEFFGNHKK